jgi:predicted nucleic acid-binding protein
MNFWDSSAITPLLVEEADTPLRQRQYRESGILTVWYGTVLEIHSALSRKRREDHLTPQQLRSARAALDTLAGSWDEVCPGLQVRDRAVRLLYTHPLRAADAFQLAAALVITRESPNGNRFLTGDQRLRDAAEQEGFNVG